MAVRPTAAVGLQGQEPGRGTPDRREGPRLIADLSDPGDQAARQDLEALAAGVSRVLRNRPRKQRWHRSGQRADRTPPPSRPRLPQPRALSATHAAHRRRARSPPPQVGRALNRFPFCEAMLKSDSTGLEGGLELPRNTIHNLDKRSHEVLDSK